MVYSFRCLILQVFCQVNVLELRREKMLCHILDPGWDGSREEEDLDVLGRLLLNGVHNRLDVLLEP